MIKTFIKTYIIVFAEYVAGFAAALLATLGVGQLFKRIWPDVFE